MKKIFYLLGTMTFLFSCKKESSNLLMESNSINVYRNTQNKSDTLIADVYDSTSKITTYFYGGSNNNGVPKDIKSLILEKKGSDTLHHYIFDSLNRIITVYSSLKNGTKLNIVIKMNYSSIADIVTVSFYNYNWITKLDTLKNQITYDYSNSSGLVTFGDDFTKSEKDDFIKDIENIKKSLYTKEKMFGAAIFVSLGVCLVSKAVCPIAFASLLGTTTLLSGQIAKGAELKTVQNPTAPKSPSSQFIPNPISSPLNLKPKYFFGKWEAAYNAGSQYYSFQSDGKYTWDVSKSFNVFPIQGTWRFENNKLYLEDRINREQWQVVKIISDNLFYVTFVPGITVLRQEDNPLLFKKY